MVRRSCWFVFVVLAIVASACAGRQPRTYVLPLPPSAGPQFSYPPPSVPSIRSCWDSTMQMSQYGIRLGEWFDNSWSSTPTLFIITDKATGETVCSGVIKPGPGPEARRFGPAIWAHKTAKTEWIVTGTSYITGVNASRTEGSVDDNAVRLEYVSGYGWYARCPC